MTNPLLDFSGLPRFADIRTEHVTPAIRQLLADGRGVLAAIRDDAARPTWQNFVQPMMDANERLTRAWSQVSHLNAVMNGPALRETYNANLPLITQYFAELGQDPVLFEKFRRIRDDADFDELSAARKTVIEHELRDFRLGGAELPPAEKERFLKIQEELSALSSRFSDNLLDATNGYTLHVDDGTKLSGIPADVLETARNLAAANGSTGWTFTLHAPAYLPVMQYADDRALRETLYHAYSTRASELAKPEWDNTPLIDRILALRGEEAQMLGFDCYAEVSLATKMASSPRQVLDFLEELAGRARPYAQRDLEELSRFAADRLGLEALEAWDLAYASEKLRLDRYAFSDQEVRQYFPETSVLSGMFRLVESLYGITIAEPRDASGIQHWHPDVKFFEILDAAGDLIGQFYLDLYARPGKRGGGWMDDAISRRRVHGKGEGGSRIQTPVAYLTCNFSAPVPLDGRTRPALFTHDEVITLFHEFGHGLHHLLTRIEDLGVSGINGVEWDAVELPSQFMENFCWEREVLAALTRHVDTGEPLPQALFEKMLAARNFQSGLQTLRQIEFSLFDMRLHTDFAPGGGKTVRQLLDEIRRQIAVVIPPAYNRFPNSFSHIFAGGYAAGYYSYKWAEVLSADAYSLFEENANGVIDAAIGARFRDEILAIGGSRRALESFIAFRGREPSLEALLRHHGMVPA
ncbi:M3 family metallopeptidase [Nitrosovibrio sp. Nv17]|uniref:M3 family metallopeptidase n=1 Tax=Nitrosovibrio sp. Nv17 TaxID=1855339 RepID=UPI000908BB83|nr:M3 family metallopeptidase [Nitrosovibrio sp. Nv17]SFW19997.1 oligopeptidase A Metallo peptidase. MEROPS family M03A [Nitrosovibrio sp. Nv17]